MSEILYRRTTHHTRETTPSWKVPLKQQKRLWDRILELLKKERDNGGTLDVDTETVSTITSHKPGYISEELEKIVGLQTDAPLRRAIMPSGGIRMVKQACEAYGYKLDPKIEHFYNEYRKTHNQGVFDAYTPEIRRARRAGIITGLPDAYGRGRIIGDYRRVALYGVDRLIEDKRSRWKSWKPPGWRMRSSGRGRNYRSA